MFVCVLDTRVLQGRDQHPGPGEPRGVQHPGGLQVCVPHVLRHGLFLLLLRSAYDWRPQQQRPPGRHPERVGVTTNRLATAVHVI